MNPLKWILTVAAAAAMATSLHAADDTVRYVARPGSTVTIDGTSSIHDWTVEGKIIGGYLEVEKAFQSDLSLKSVKSLTAKNPNPKAVISIPLRSLKSGKDSMDRIMLEAMKADANPMLKYELKEMVVKGDVPASGTPVKFDTKGDLSFSGETKAIDMEVTMERKDDGLVVFKGEKELKMTDFGITPPSPKIPGLSMIKTGDEVMVKFEWVTKAR
ncbi:MAG: YceI family protein [Verrucomicrobiales bacterium]|nr:YceI family protein [Verrucomicrobiales bacterium]